jgi:hypothetical protein
MNKHMGFAIALALIAAAVTVMLSIIFHLPAIWLVIALLSAGIIVFLFTYFWNQIFHYLKKTSVDVKSFLRIIFRITEFIELLQLKDRQQKNPEKWLYPVIQYIDLNRQNSAYGDIYVGFHIDSGLLYPIKEYWLSVKLYLAVDSTNRSQSSGWVKIDPMTPIQPLKSNGVGNKYSQYDDTYKKLDWGEYLDGYCIHLGLTNKDKGKNASLLKWIEEFKKERQGKECFLISPDEQKRNQDISGIKALDDNIFSMTLRQGDKMITKLAIGIALKKEDVDNPHELEGSEWIIPANNYKGA